MSGDCEELDGKEQTDAEFYQDYMSVDIWALQPRNLPSVILGEIKLNLGPLRNLRVFLDL